MSENVHVNVPVTTEGMTPDYDSPAFLRYLQDVVQKVIMRHVDEPE